MIVDGRAIGETSYILNYASVDGVNKIDQLLFNSHSRLEALMQDISDEKVNSALCNFATKSKDDHNSIQLGLLYKILMNNKTASTNFRDIMTTSRDSFTFLFKILNIFVAENLYSFKPNVLVQLLWFTNECLKHSVNNVDGLVYNILRSLIIPESRKNQHNFHLIATRGVLELIDNNKKYFLNHPHLIRDTITIVLNLIPMHCNLHQVAIQEVELSCLLLTEKFDECIIIGRDLVRFLISVANINGLNVFWTNFVSAPHKLSPNYSGIISVLDIPTSKHLAVTCITQNAEHFIVFILIQITKNLLTGKVDKDYHYYMKWLDHKFLSNNNSMQQSSKSSVIRANILRFVILLNLTSSIEAHQQQSPSEFPQIKDGKSLSDFSSESKAIFIEWLLVQPGSLSDAHLILSIVFELLVHNSQKFSEPSVELYETWDILHHLERINEKTIASICDFFPIIVSNFIASLKNEVLMNIRAAIKSCSCISNIKRFSDYLNSFNDDLPDLNQINIAKKDENLSLKSDSIIKNEQISHTQEITNETETVFVIDESEKKQQKLGSEISKDESIHQIEELGDLLESSEFTASQDISQNLKKVGKILAKMSQVDDVNSLLEKYRPTLIEILSREAESIFHFNQEHFKISIDIIFDSMFKSPIFSFLSSTAKSKSPTNFNAIYFVINELSKSIEDLTLLLLIYDIYFKDINASTASRATRNSRSKYKECYDKFTSDTSIYVDYAMRFDGENFTDHLYDDLDKCSLKCHQLFCDLLDKIYFVFGKQIIDDSRFMHLICGTVDSDQVKCLRQQIISKKVNLLPQDDIVDLIDDSLNWECIEQIYFWQILLAHNLSLNQIWQIIPDLDWTSHSEAINNIAILLKHTQPQLDIMKCLFSRHIHTNADEFVVLILDQWRPNFDSELISAMNEYLKFLKMNSRLEFRNITLTINQLNLLINSKHCSYIFDSLSVMKSLLSLINHCRNTNEIDEKFCRKIEERIKTLKSLTY
ncbi:MAG: Integrator complex subunit 3 [Marteilia pararefringens]